MGSRLPSNERVGVPPPCRCDLRRRGTRIEAPRDRSREIPAALHGRVRGKTPLHPFANVNNADDTKSPAGQEAASRAPFVTSVVYATYLRSEYFINVFYPPDPGLATSHNFNVSRILQPKRRRPSLFNDTKYSLRMARRPRRVALGPACQRHIQLSDEHFRKRRTEPAALGVLT